MLAVPWLWPPQEGIAQTSRRAGWQPGGESATARIAINGFVVSDALIDSGSQVSLIDCRVFSIIAPNSTLTPPARLVSASGHELDAQGTCKLTVGTRGTTNGKEQRR